MQMICDGVATKNEVLQDSIMQYQEVYIKAKREFETVVQVSFRRGPVKSLRAGQLTTPLQSVERYMQEQPARAIRAGRPAGGGALRGNQNHNDNNDDDDDDDGFGNGNGQGGGARGRGRGRGKAGTTTKTRKSAAPRSRGTAAKGKGSTRKDPDDDDNQGE
jgi:DNA topoisomerase-3